MRYATGLVLAAVVVGVCASAPVLAEALPEFPVGAETKVEDAAIGGKGYYLVYVPSDYTPDRKWPLVVCYHGLNGNPTTWPFKNVLGGKGCIVVGMEYYERGTGGFGKVARDVDNVKRLLPPLVRKLSVDTNQLFIGGFSKGGFMTCSIAARTTSLWAGILVLGGGRSGSGSGGPNAYQGKPVYVGVGENDQYRKSAESAAASYRTLGAKVTLEVYKGLGHAVDASSKVMRDWFLANTVFRQVEPTVAKAVELAKRRKTGLAYKTYLEAAAVSETFEPCQKAAQAAQALADAFAKRADEAEQAAANGQVSRAADILRKLAREFAGCQLGDRAKARLPEIVKPAKKPGS